MKPRAAWSVAAALALAAAAHAGNALAATPAPRDAAAPTAEETSAARQLDRLMAVLGEADAGARRAAVKGIADLGAEAVPAMAERLEQARRAAAQGLAGAPADADVAAVLREARKGAPRGDADLVEALLAGPDASSPATRSALATLAMVRALTHVATTPAVRALVAIAGDAGGAYRNELASALKVLGDRSVAALLEARLSPSAEVRRWSANQLEAMNKRIPADAVQTRSNEVLADVLHAFATLKDMDALPIVLSFVNSDRVLVRQAARDAIARYAGDATSKLREAFSNLTGKAAPDTWSTADVARELFAAYDRFRMQEVYTLLEDGLAKHRAGNVDEAVGAFDRVLARQPLLDRRTDMVPAYIQYAQAREETDRPGALAAYRKASRLAPEPHRASQIESAIAYIEAQDLLARGIADAEAFRRAIALDPGNVRARAALDQLEGDGDKRQERVRRLAAGAIILVLAIAGIVLFGGRRRES